jgi:ABC-type transport system involved in cytochrome bd biosynthesis fused ATPase/permease subunit
LVSAMAAIDMAASPRDKKYYNRSTKLHAHFLNSLASKLHTIWSCPPPALPLG